MLRHRVDTNAEVLKRLVRAYARDEKDWARRQFTEEELVAGLRELRDQGGHDLSELLHDVEPHADAR